MLLFVADLGNTRLKLGVARPGEELEAASFPADAPDTWRLPEPLRSGESPEIRVAVSTVNASASPFLERFLETNGLSTATWYRTAADVPIRHRVERAESAGPDRALGVLGALDIIAKQGPSPGLVISCGSAVTVDLVSEEAIWQGGSIAPGLRVTSDALNRLSPRLPTVEIHGQPPPPIGRSTKPALEAGVYWSVVGGIREITSRLRASLQCEPWVVWTGGDAELIRLGCDFAFATERLVPNLVLLGLLSTLRSAGDSP